MDYGKYKYELSQKAKSSRKNQVKINVKEIQLKPKIDTHDFKNKLNQSIKFLSEGDKVKFTMRFRGREAEHPEFGQRVLDRFKEELGDIFIENKGNGQPPVAIEHQIEFSKLSLGNNLVMSH